MRLRGNVYRIASRFQEGSGSEWTGKAWAWDLMDLDAPIVRIDGMPTIVDHGYADDQQAAYFTCLGALQVRREHDLNVFFRADNLRRTAETVAEVEGEVGASVPDGVWAGFVRLLTGR